jgi:hypothetical protein
MNPDIIDIKPEELLKETLTTIVLVKRRISELE